MAVMQKEKEAQGIPHSRSLGPGALLELLEVQRAQSQALALANDPPAAPAGPPSAPVRALLPPSSAPLPISPLRVPSPIPMQSRAFRVGRS